MRILKRVVKKAGYSEITQ